MPLIEKSQNTLEKIKGIKIDSKILSEVNAYCKYFEVSIEEFANQAFKYILHKDKDWQNRAHKDK